MSATNAMQALEGHAIYDGGYNRVSLLWFVQYDGMLPKAEDWSSNLVVFETGWKAKSELKLIKLCPTAQNHIFPAQGLECERQQWSGHGLHNHCWRSDTTASSRGTGLWPTSRRCHPCQLLPGCGCRPADGRRRNACRPEWTTTYRWSSSNRGTVNFAWALHCFKRCNAGLNCYTTRLMSSEGHFPIIPAVEKPQEHNCWRGRFWCWSCSWPISVLAQEMTMRLPTSMLQREQNWLPRILEPLLHNMVPQQVCTPSRFAVRMILSMTFQWEVFSFITSSGSWATWDPPQFRSWPAGAFICFTLNDVLLHLRRNRSLYTCVTVLLLQAWTCPSYFPHFPPPKSFPHPTTSKGQKVSSSRLSYWRMLNSRGTTVTIWRPSSTASAALPASVRSPSRRPLRRTPWNSPSTVRSTPGATRVWRTWTAVWCAPTTFCCRWKLTGIQISLCSVMAWLPAYLSFFSRVSELIGGMCTFSLRGHICTFSCCIAGLLRSKLSSHQSPLDLQFCVSLLVWASYLQVKGRPHNMGNPKELHSSLL